MATRRLRHIKRLVRRWALVLRDILLIEQYTDILLVLSQHTKYWAAQGMLRSKPAPQQKAR